MNERQARRALLIRALETAPEPERRSVWSDADRDWASRSALAAVGESVPVETLVARRTELAWSRLAQRDRALVRVDRALEPRPWSGWLVAALGLVAGFAADAIGPEQRVNLLAPPLLALLAWNLVAYIGFALRGMGRPGRLAGPLARLARWAAGVVRPGGRREDGAVPAGFLRDWLERSSPLTSTRAARLLHLGAFALAFGAVAGLYLRGLAFEYRAGWESTFLDADSVHALLSVVLGPAATLTGIPLPGPEHLEGLRMPASSGENAARWIHLWATTVGMLVLAPRGLLSVLAWRRERRLQSDFPLPLDDLYFRGIARAARNEPLQVTVLPYSMHPDAEQVSGLRQLLSAALAADIRLEVADPVAYGEEDAFSLEPSAPNAVVIALFALAATPEADSQGAFARALAARAAGKLQALALVDESGHRARFGAADDGRRATRARAWMQLLADSGLEAACVDLRRRPADDQHTRAVRELFERAGAAPPVAA